MWNEQHFHEARRACHFQIEKLSSQLPATSPGGEEAQGEREMLLDEWQHTRNALDCLETFRQSGRFQEVGTLIPLLQDHLRSLSNRSFWPEDYYYENEPEQAD
jgi:hypothetical protein